MRKDKKKPSILQNSKGRLKLLKTEKMYLRIHEQSRIRSLLLFSYSSSEDDESSSNNESHRMKKKTGQVKQDDLARHHLESKMRESYINKINEDNLSAETESKADDDNDESTNSNEAKSNSKPSRKKTPLKPRHPQPKPDTRKSS